VYRTGRRRAQTALIAALLIGLFLTFYPVCVAAAAALLADAARRAWAAAGTWRARLYAAAREISPVAIAALAIAPLLVFFETVQIAAVFSARLQFSASMYADNVRALLWQLLRYDTLAPAVLSSVAWYVAARRGRGRDALDETGREAAAFLCILVLIHSLVSTGNPVLFSRHFIAIVPALLGLACLAAAQALRPRAGRRATAAPVALVALSACVFLAGQWEILSRRLAEVHTPVRGPLDFAVPFLRERYEDPADLVLATNYEAQAFEYYLGCTVAEVPRPGDGSPLPAVDPDVVVPRRWWSNVVRLQDYLRGRNWAVERFPVVDVPYNNIPELTNVSRRLTVLHQFRTPETHDPGSEFLLYWRPDPAGRATR
jgi:hypothetical protein